MNSPTISTDCQRQALDEGSSLSVAKTTVLKWILMTRDRRGRDLNVCLFLYEESPSLASLA